MYNSIAKLLNEYKIILTFLNSLFSALIFRRICSLVLRYPFFLCSLMTISEIIAILAFYLRPSMFRSHHVSIRERISILETF